MLPETLTALASASGQAIVTAARTADWPRIRRAFATWFAQVENRGVEVRLTALDETASLVRGASPERHPGIRLLEGVRWTQAVTQALENLEGDERDQAAARLFRELNTTTALSVVSPRDLLPFGSPFDWREEPLIHEPIERGSRPVVARSAHQAYERTYHVGIAVASLAEGLFQPPLEEALHQSWIPGVSITRYGRAWHLARMRIDNPEAITGQIGFVSDGTVETTFFDQATGEFVTESVPGGVVVPFAIRTSDGVIAYQIRPSVVREESFVGALEALLNLGARTYLWSIRTAVEPTAWAEWSGSVDKVTSFTFRLERPNPHYADDHLVEQVVEGVRLEYVRISGAATSDGVDLDSDLFRQSVNHVLKEYGRAEIHGVDADGEETTWFKPKGMLGSVASRIRLRRVGGPKISDLELIEVLDTTPPVTTTADVRGLSDEREES